MACRTFFWSRTTLVHFFSSRPSYFLVVFASKASSFRSSSSRKAAAVFFSLFAVKYAMMDLCLDQQRHQHLIVGLETPGPLARRDAQLLSLPRRQEGRHVVADTRPAMVPLASKSRRSVAMLSGGGVGECVFGDLEHSRTENEAALPWPQSLTPRLGQVSGSQPERVLCRKVSALVWTCELVPERAIPRRRSCVRTN